jgi:adenine-specific DNA-methyltransferase
LKAGSSPGDWQAEAKQNGNTLRVAISFGPQHGPVTAHQVQEAIPTAKMNGYQVLLFAGFAFDPEAQALIQKAPVAGLQVHFANIAPDVLVGDLLKTTRASQIFTVCGCGAKDSRWKMACPGL